MIKHQATDRMYQTAQPPEHLEKYIDFFWVGEQENNSGPIFPHHAIASSKLEMQFHYIGNYVTAGLNGHSEKVFKAGFFGQSDKYKYYFAASKKTGIFSVRFLPLALATLFNTPANLLTNESYDIASILGKQGNEIEEQIFEAKTFSERIQIITTFIEKKIKTSQSKYQRFEKILTKIHHTKGRIPVKEITTQAFRSQRQFERNFKELTGFSAKNYLKIIRFERVVETIIYSQSLANLKLIDIALDFGYYDQAHFNRHFKEYTGITPTTYFNNLALQDF